MNQIVVVSPDELQNIVRNAVELGVGAAIANLNLKTPKEMNEIQAAEYLGVQPATLRGWRVDKRGPIYHKSGRSVRYSRADLDDWIKNNKVLTIDAVERYRGTFC